MFNFNLKIRLAEMPWPTRLAWITVPLEINPIFQFYKGWASGETSQIEPFTFIIILVIGAIWMKYGYSIRSWPLFIGNVVKCVSSMSVVTLYYAS